MVIILQLKHATNNQKHGKLQIKWHRQKNHISKDQTFTGHVECDNTERCIIILSYRAVSSTFSLSSRFQFRGKLSKIFKSSGLMKIITIFIFRIKLINLSKTFKGGWNYWRIWIHFNEFEYKMENELKLYLFLFSPFPNGECIEAVRKCSSKWKCDATFSRST